LHTLTAAQRDTLEALGADGHMMANWRSIAE